MKMMITKTIAAVVLASLATTTTTTQAFAPIQVPSSRSSHVTATTSSPLSMAVSSVDLVLGKTSMPLLDKKTSPPNSPKKKQHGQSGVLSPVVQVAKRIVNDDKAFNQLRAKAIGLHTEVIGNFVATAETPFGQRALKQLFTIIDRDQSGTVDHDELATAFQSLGFDWLKAKQVEKIIERADQDANGVLDFGEWCQEAPKLLRTNLIKLAKKNGGELGLLA